MKFKRSKAINLICTALIGVIFVLATLIIMSLTGTFDFRGNDLVFISESAEATYDGTPLVAHHWHLTGGKLRSGHKAEVEFISEQTDVGQCENIITVQISNSEGEDVTGEYNITFNYGTLKVVQRKLTIGTGSAQKVYDGTPLTEGSVYVRDGLVKGHNTVSRAIGSQTEIGSSPNTLSSVMIYDESGRVVTPNYQIIIEEGTLRVLSPWQGSGSTGSTGSTGSSGSSGNSGSSGSTGILSGSQNTDPLEDVFKPSSSLLTAFGGKTKILYSVCATEGGRIYLKMQSYLDYTGKAWSEAPAFPLHTSGVYFSYSPSYLTSIALTESGASVHSIKIVPNNAVYALPYYMSLSVGSYNIQTSDVAAIGYNGEEYTVGYSNYDENAAPLVGPYAEQEKVYRDYVYSKYLSVDSESRAYMQKIIREEGFSLSDPDIINDIASFIKGSAKYNLDYDYKLDLENNIAVAFMEEYKEGVCRHYASAATLLYRTLGIPARYTVGVAAEVKADTWTDIKSSDMHAWVEVYIDGIGWVQVEVTGNVDGSGIGGGSEPNKQILEITPVAVEKRYDGTPLKAVAAVEGLEKLVKMGYTYKVEVAGERTELGISYSEIKSITIYDSHGNDATDYFSLVFSKGKIHVYSEVLYFASESYIKTYDGNFTVKATMVNESLIDPDYRYEIKSLLNIGVGSQINKFDVIIYDKSGNDVTSHYKILKKYGTVTIEAIKITVKAGSAESDDYRNALTCNEAMIVSGALLDGDKVDVIIIEGEQSGIGRSDNIVSHIVIVNGDGVDVTACYEIKFEVGVLEIVRKT